MSAMEDRVLALAGLAQALRQVRRIADTGQADSDIVATALDSVFRLDAPSPTAVYGDVAALRPGLRTGSRGRRPRRTCAAPRSIAIANTRNPAK